MKKLLTNAKALTFAAVAGMSTVFGLTSCQQDDYVDEPNKNAVPAQSAVTEMNKDSVFVNTFKFDYDNVGITSPDQYVADINFGPKASSVKSRLAFTPDVDLAIKIIQTISSVVSAGSSVSKAISDNEVVAQLETVTKDLNVVKTMISDLEKKITDTEVVGYYNKHMYEYYCFDTNGEYLSSFLEFLHEGDVESAYEIADLWAKQDLDCGQAVKGIKAMMESIPTFITSDMMNLTQMYDYWVYQTTPWEHMGYQKRAQLRLADVSICASGYILGHAYYEHQLALSTAAGDKAAMADAKIGLKAIEDAFDAFKTFYEKNIKFTRHDDKLICQIKDAHMVFDKDIVLSDMNAHNWAPKHTEIEGSDGLKNFMYGEENRGAATVLNSSLSPDEFNAICNYYGGKAVEDSLAKVGFEVSKLQDGKRHVLPLNSGCSRESEHWYNNNYYLKYNKVAIVNEENPVKSNWTVGSMWILNEKKYLPNPIPTREGVINYTFVECLQNWDHMENTNAQYFHLKIDQRYKGVYPLDQNK